MAKNFTLFSHNYFFSLDEKTLNTDGGNPIGLKEKTLPDNEMCPGDAVVNNILNFSKVLKIEKSCSAGLIEFVLN